jgi:hypothetical protein
VHFAQVCGKHLTDLLQFWQAIDINLLATHTLSNLFTRSPTLKSQPGILDWLASHEAKKIDPTTPDGKAWNRVLSAKATREAVDSVTLKWQGGKVKGPSAAESRKRKRDEKGDEQKKAPKKMKPEGAASESVESADEDDWGGRLASASSSSDEGEDDREGDTAISTTFLPSLSAGYTLGESDSDDDVIDDEPVAAERKNRRGQRARRLYVLAVSLSHTTF